MTAVPLFLRRLLAALLVLGSTLTLAGCAREQVFQSEAFVLGTHVQMSVYGNSRDEAEAAMAAVAREFDRLHHAYHAWKPSELSALNEALARGESLEVSDELAALIRDAQQFSATGDGLFDPAIGKLIALWGFHAEEFEEKLPDPAALQALIALHPRISDVVVEGRRISSRNPAVQLDLGGYAKGYALDRAASILRERGIRNALVNIGGNVIALGAKGKTPWRLGLRHPREPRTLGTLPLYDGEATGTSGDYQRFFTLGGVRYAHLLDPRTGWPTTGTQALTVLVTPRENAGTLSDAASKPAFIAGDAWLPHLQRHRIEHGLRVAADGSIEVTRLMRARIQFAPDVGPIRVVD